MRTPDSFTGGNDTYGLTDADKAAFGDPSNGSGTGGPCTAVAGYYPAGLPGHYDASGFCVAN